MRYTPSIPPLATSPNTRQVGGLSRIHAVKPVPAADQAVPHVENQALRQVPIPLEQQYQRAESFEDRRKVCRRVSHQPVLVELRSGLDRRRHNLREGDLVEHIDETA
jgi:hypothetical protein